MAKIEGIRIKNYQILKDITLGKIIENNEKPLEKLSVVIGKNGSGKSTLFDAFGFLSDCLNNGVGFACENNNRGGFNKIRSQGINDPISFEIYYRPTESDRPITYQLDIDIDKTNKPFVLAEKLLQRRQYQKSGKPLAFLILSKGKGYCWKGDYEGTVDEKNNILAITESNEVIKVELTNKQELGISSLGSLKEHPRISSLKNFIENWYLSYFSPEIARTPTSSGSQKHLNIYGDNIANYIQYLENEHKDRLKTILSSIANKIPGLSNISTKSSDDGRLMLRFHDKSFSEPFYAQKASDGTLKLLAYLLLLEDPTPAPLICIEEPENGLYPKLLQILIDEFRKHTIKPKGSQIFITTHQPEILNALHPKELWVLEKQKDGFSNIKRATEYPLINEMYSQDQYLGNLWFNDYFDMRL